MDKHVEFLVKLRDFESLAPPEVKEDSEKTEDEKTIFNELNYECEEGPRIGAFQATQLASTPSTTVTTDNFNCQKNVSSAAEKNFRVEKPVVSVVAGVLTEENEKKETGLGAA